MIKKIKKCSLIIDEIIREESFEVDYGNRINVIGKTELLTERRKKELTYIKEHNPEWLL